MYWYENIKKPIVGLAPMHAVSKSPLRKASIGYGADVTYSEMIASEAIIRRIPQAFNMMGFADDERPFIIQIFGSNPKTMAQAARVVEDEFSPDGIDINFGCPVQKAAKQGFGAIQLSDNKKAREIVTAVKKSLKKTPLSIKMRLVSRNINDSINFISEIEKTGIYMVVIHGRTPTQKYKGKADWQAIQKIKKHFPNILILGSGDIDSPEKLEECIGNLDGALIGRAAKRDPKIFSILKNS